MDIRRVRCQYQVTQPSLKNLAFSSSTSKSSLFKEQGMVPGVEDGISGLETQALLPAELRAQAQVCGFILGEDISESSSDLVSGIRTKVAGIP